MLKAGPAACWLWVCGLAYCQKHGTDGIIPAEALPWLGVTGPHKLAALLVLAGLWHADERSWRVHDYLSWNDSSDERRDKIEAKKERQRKWREARERDGDASTERNGDASTKRLGDAAPTPTPPPPPSPPPPPPPSPLPPPLPLPPPTEGGARAHGGLIAPPRAWGVKHSDHVTGFCDWMCLPSDLSGQFASRCQWSDGEIVAWAGAVRRRFEAESLVPTGKMYDFWNARWLEEFGDSQANAKHADAASAVREALRRV
jgi:hypothetical protein